MYIFWDFLNMMYCMFVQLNGFLWWGRMEHSA
jgi:hypothetical protein